MDWSHWLDAHLALTVNRLAGLLGCLLVAHLVRGLRYWGWHFGAPRKPLLFLACVTGVYILHFFGWPHSHGLTGRRLALGCLVVAPIALYEEALFRGLLFTFLKERLKPPLAAMVSSLVFILIHPTSVGAWTLILLYGLALCAASHAGVGLPWLVLAHFLVDASGVVIGFEMSDSAPWQYTLGMGLMLAASVWSIRLLNPTPPAVPGQVSPEAQAGS